MVKKIRKQKSTDTIRISKRVTEEKLTRRQGKIPLSRDLDHSNQECGFHAAWKRKRPLPVEASSVHTANLSARQVHTWVGAAPPPLAMQFPQQRLDEDWRKEDENGVLEQKKNDTNNPDNI
jgi:hypothetical protein